MLNIHVKLLNKLAATVKKNQINYYDFILLPRCFILNQFI